MQKAAWYAHTSNVIHKRTQSNFLSHELTLLTHNKLGLVCRKRHDTHTLTMWSTNAHNPTFSLTNSRRLTLLPHNNPPAPMNHVKYLRAGPAEMPFQTWYADNTNHFRLTDFCQVEIKNTTGLSNKPSTTQSCAEDQILENKISRTGF